MTPRRASGDILAPALIAAIIGAVAAFGVWAQEPWLAPSLGSAVFTQLLHPEESSAKPFAILVGQILAPRSDLPGVCRQRRLAVALHGRPQAAAGPRVGNRHNISSRCDPVARLRRALTPAGGATALVVAMGAEADDLSGALHLAVGLVLVTALGEPARRLILRSGRRA